MPVQWRLKDFSQGGGKIYSGRAEASIFSHIMGAKDAFSYEFDPPPGQKFLKSGTKMHYVYYSNLIFSAKSKYQPTRV